ncbi:hypothetical protein AB1N83_007487 [Pleurotus pulmonarius]
MCVLRLSAPTVVVRFLGNDSGNVNTTQQTIWALLSSRGRVLASAIATYGASYFLCGLGQVPSFRIFGWLGCKYASFDTATVGKDLVHSYDVPT